jgi:hypothetical protein
MTTQLQVVPASAVEPVDQLEAAARIWAEVVADLAVNLRQVLDDDDDTSRRKLLQATAEHARIVLKLHEMLLQILEAAGPN